MSTNNTEVRRCTVHRRRGESQVLVETVTWSTSCPSARTVADHVPLGEIMGRELVCARPDLEIAKVVSLMVRHRVGCIPVVDERRKPVGVITKFDLVEHLDAAMQSVADGSPLPTDIAARQADEVMMPIALALEENATVAHAAAMMALEDTHHVLVIRATGELIGVVSAKDVVKWLVANDGLATATDTSRTSDSGA